MQNVFEQDRDDQLAQIGTEILNASRNELYLRMRFLDVALWSLTDQADYEIYLAGTDGRSVYYKPGQLASFYRRNRILVNRLYLHMILHCIFRHVFRRGRRDERLWNLACDIAVESVVDEWDVRSIRMPASWLKKETYKGMRIKFKTLTAERIYQFLKREEMAEKDLEALEREFTVDDHRYWFAPDSQKPPEAAQQKWDDISQQIETDMETFSQESSANSGHFLDQIQIENRKKCKYREFLKKFAVWREEMKVDEDTFDYGFYSYGLSLYGNLPLIEPQEWKESKKVEEFAIVIDTSMSCSSTLVRKFLEETYGILSEEGTFFRKVRIHIIQCDDQVQKDKEITCERELKEYMDHLELAGEGGTDFRPAFAYVDQLVNEGRLSGLRGMLYFTDGYGIYPSRKPAYDTAFVFLEDSYNDADVPSWAIRLVLEEEQDEY